MKNLIFLIVGIIMFSLGAYQNTQYEENSLIVMATITHVETTDETDDGPISYKHTYYGEYTVDGKLYTDKKLGSSYTSSSFPPNVRGDLIEIRINPENPDKKVAEGGLFATAGFVLIIYNGIKVLGSRKTKKEETTAE